MNKNSLTLIIAITAIFLIPVSCNTYKSIQNVEKISQLSGNPFVKDVAKSVMKNIGTYIQKMGIATPGKLSLITPLSSIFTTTEQINGLKDLVATKYMISPKKLNTDFSKMGTIRDLVQYVARNGKGFQFYKSTGSL